MTRQSYATDLSEAQWARVEALLPRHGGSGGRGRPAKHPRRRMLEAMLYLERTGCQWRNLPHDFPPWSSVWELFWRWRQKGVLKAVHRALRDQCRQRTGRPAAPSAAILDSQSVQTTEKGGRAASTRAKRSRAASATCSSTPRA